MSATILIIEDDPASLELMTYLLTAHGYGTLTANRGDAGLETARQRHPDLIICDIQLPVLDGYAIARALKSDPELCNIPVVAVSAMAMVGDREKGLSAGFDAYVSKPIDPLHFGSQIHPLLKPEQRSSLAARPAVEAAAPLAPPSRGTLLVVDDTALNLELNRSIFEPLGYQVLTAETVAAGLQLAREHSPSLIISDLSLPLTSGFEFLQELKQDQRLCSIPVVIITATYRESEAQAESLSLGAARFLVRPIDSQQVLREVESCLAATHGGRSGLDPGH